MVVILRVDLYESNDNSMITDAVLYIYTSVASFLLSLFPTYTGLPAELTTSFVWFANQTNLVCSFVPCQTFRTIILLAIGVELTLLGFYIVSWLLGKQKVS